MRFFLDLCLPNYASETDHNLVVRVTSNQIRVNPSIYDSSPNSLSYVITMATSDVT